ncbi:MAG: pyridoxamine 5'-phosphate oxidase family protein [Nitrospirota bacterium]|nr:pyridoxamine 5'-phosphate oxidase family protein [Nitrospirota bacterium]
MPEVYAELDEKLTAFIKAQKMFLVATAPDNLAEGHVSLSPKGAGTLEVLDGTTVVYGDYPGSENEIANNLAQNGRLTMVFISFDETPMILRLYGRGEAVPVDSPYGKELAERMAKVVGTAEIRQWIVMHAKTIKTGCGNFIPVYRYLGEREQTKDYLA